jgi:TetR/AcrR family transcriptional regulator, cholesterol catabolism regulator
MKQATIDEGGRGSATTGDAILEAALELFAKRGYHATSMRDIASAASVYPAGIYHWYENKEAILLRLQNDFLDDLSTEVIAAVEKQERPDARVAAAVWEHVVFHGNHQMAAFVTDSEIRSLTPDPRRELVDKRDAYQEMFVALIQEGVDQEVFRTADVRVATYAILLQCTGVALWFQASGKRTLAEVAAIHVELVLGSLSMSRRRIAAALKAIA